MKYLIILACLLFLSSCVPGDSSRYEQAFWYGYNGCQNNPYSHDCVGPRNKMK